MHRRHSEHVTWLGDPYGPKFSVHRTWMLSEDRAQGHAGVQVFNEDHIVQLEDTHTRCRSVLLRPVIFEIECILDDFAGASHPDSSKFVWRIQGGNAPLAGARNCRKNPERAISFRSKYHCQIQVYRRSTVTVNDGEERCEQDDPIHSEWKAKHTENLKGMRECPLGRTGCLARITARMLIGWGLGSY